MCSLILIAFDPYEEDLHSHEAKSRECYKNSALFHGFPTMRSSVDIISWIISSQFRVGGTNPEYSPTKIAREQENALFSHTSMHGIERDSPSSIAPIIVDFAHDQTPTGRRGPMTSFSSFLTEGTRKVRATLPE